MEKGSVKGVLLYGPDKGYISRICSSIIERFNLTTTNAEYKSLSAGHLGMMLNSRNFFQQRELIKVSSVSAGLDKDLKEVLLSDFLHFAAFIADELPSTSSIRKFFETEGSLASIGCYNDDEQSTSRIIIQKLTEAKKTIDEEALTFLKSHLKGDSELISSEINKLITYADDSRHITLAEAEQVISKELVASGDEMCIYFAQKNLDKFLEEVRKLQAQNINEVLIIRALIRYYLNLYTVLARTENGQAVDEAVKSLSPPIFFKYVQDFKKNLERLTTCDTIMTLEVLSKAEAEFKTNPGSFDFYYNVFLPVWAK